MSKAEKVREAVLAALTAKATKDPEDPEFTVTRFVLSPAQKAALGLRGDGVAEVSQACQWLERFGYIERAIWNASRLRWRYITDEMRARKDAAFAKAQFRRELADAIEPELRRQRVTYVRLKDHSFTLDPEDLAVLLPPLYAVYVAATKAESKG